MSGKKRKTDHTPVALQEGFIIEGLTSYDMEREPLKLIEDESTCTLPLGLFAKELQCPICLGLLSNTLTSMECLHRFCSDCVNSSIRKVKKECPVCRVECATRRAFRPDPLFDELITSLYGDDIDAFEEKMEKETQKLTSQTNEALQKSYAEGMKRQLALVAQENAKNAPPPSSSSSTQPKALVSFQLCAHDDSPDIFKPRWIRVDGGANVGVLRALVSKQILPGRKGQVQITSTKDGSDDLGDKTTL
eukprot:CAMPEP_0201527418 /NCGR_PEP_ID=MMETSP0161_2-20130828/35111_1 /ASSEMBLY_ACC=CAM_ASM_000251 /TAXON_ID=180227 /ORGANISM="Neoparamoeba aestuarina, Strain SoJaBio B1-5/56/2" /LENGTH=247 /DNA_ID=CAMNT_0047928247 /DNA_START=131 /DNA_END=870 /DNA_ORIENTATION=-